MIVTITYKGEEIGCPRKEYTVITQSGLDVFGPNSKKMCKAYIRQAIKKGSKPGFLSICEAEKHGV